MGAPSIRVNELMLGLVEERHGPGTRGWELLSDQQQALIRHTPLGRTGTPAEVAQAVLFLVRDADFMTGSVLRMDGGFVLGGDPPSIMPAGVITSYSIHYTKLYEGLHRGRNLRPFSRPLRS